MHPSQAGRACRRAAPRGRSLHRGLPKNLGPDRRKPGQGRARRGPPLRQRQMGSDPRPATRGAAVAVDRQRTPAEGGLRDRPFDPPALRGRAAGRGGFVSGAATGRRGARRGAPGRPAATRGGDQPARRARTRAGPASGHHPAGPGSSRTRPARQAGLAGEPTPRSERGAATSETRGSVRARPAATQPAPSLEQVGPGCPRGTGRGFGAARGGGTCARGGGLLARRKAAAQARGARLGRGRIPQHREHDADLGLVLGVRLPGCLGAAAPRAVGARTPVACALGRPERARAGRATSPAGAAGRAGAGSPTTATRPRARTTES